MHLVHSAAVLAAAVGAVLLTWAIVIPLLVGVGRTAIGAVSVLGGGPRAGLRPVLLFWVGVATTIGFLQLWQLALPIGPAALAVFVGWGLLGLIVGRGEWRAVVRSLPPAAVVTFAVLAVWAADRSIGPMRAYDSGLYHLQVIRWANAFPIVVGLGNLHGRLAFNNAGLLLDALLNVGPWHGRVEHVCNGLLLLPLLWEGCLATAGKPARPAVRVFAAVLLVPLIYAMLGRDFASPTSDFAPFALTLAMGLRAVEYATSADEREAGTVAVGIVAIAAAAVATKLSVIAFAGSTAAVVGLHRLSVARRPREAIAAVIVAAAVLVPWVGRGVLLSGYPLYPSAAVATNVPWRVPATLVAVEREGVRVWGRQYYQLPRPVGRPTGWPWLRGWIGGLPKGGLFEVCVPAVLTVAAVASVAARRRRRGPGSRTVALVTVIPAAIGIAFWFATAPAPRFATSAFWTLAAGAAAATVVGDLGAIVTVAIALAAMVALQARTYGDPRTSPLNRVPPVWITAGADHGFGARPRPDVVDFVTRSGLHVGVPRQGDQTWDAPLPAAPYARPGLRLRRPGDPAGGFVLDDDETLKR